MARLATRLAEAEAALATLDEAVRTEPRSLMERDSAILRPIYTFEAVWKVCQQLLVEREDIEVASPNTSIRAARRLGWLSDEDAEAAMKDWPGSQPRSAHVPRSGRGGYRRAFPRSRCSVAALARARCCRVEPCHRLCGSLIERTMHFSPGCTICAGGWHPLWVLNIGYGSSGTRQLSLRREQVEEIRYWL